LASRQHKGAEESARREELQTKLRTSEENLGESSGEHIDLKVFEEFQACSPC